MAVEFHVGLENDNISLIQLNEEHFNELYARANNPDIWEQHPEKDRWQKEKFKTYFKNALNNKEGCFCIHDKKTNKLIGSTRYYSYDEDDKSVRIGYTFITPEYWGTPTNFGIKRLMLDYIFHYLDKVYFGIGKENYRSQKSVEKLGAKKQVQEINNNLIFMLTKENWHNQKE